MRRLYMILAFTVAMVLANIETGRTSDQGSGGINPGAFPPAPPSMPPGTVYLLPPGSFPEPQAGLIFPPGDLADLEIAIYRAVTEFMNNLQIETPAQANPPVEKGKEGDLGTRG